MPSPEVWAFAKGTNKVKDNNKNSFFIIDSFYGLTWRRIFDLLRRASSQ